MVLALYAIIAWITIIVLFIIPKRLSLAENIILFFCFSIVIISVFTIIDLNLKLIQHSDKADLFISMWLHRNIIIPSWLLIFVNLLNSDRLRIKRIYLYICVFLVLYLIGLLNVFIGVKSYIWWNNYANNILYAALMICSVLLTKLIRKIP